MFADIQAVSFDVGGTLIDPWPSVGHVYSSVAARHGLVIDAARLNESFATAWRAKSAFDYSRASWSEIVSKTFHGDNQVVEEVAFFDELYERFAAAEVWRIYDDVLPALEELLVRGLKLAVISNWDERLRPLLCQLKLDRYFDVIAISSEIGFQKPSPVIFEHVVKKLALPACAVLHVGDSALEDVEGARQAGLKAIRLKRDGQTSDEFHLRTLLALNDVIGNRRQD